MTDQDKDSFPDELFGGRESDALDGSSPKEQEAPPEYFLGEMTADDVLGRLNQIQEVPQHLKALESRAFGKMGSLEATVRKLQEGLPTRVGLDPEKFTRIAAYDKNLAEALVEDLKEALKVFSLEEGVVSPFLEKPLGELRRQIASELIESYHPDIDDFVPDDWNNPANQRQKDYAQWLTLQSYETQQALAEREGAKAVRALSAFKEWEQKRIQDRKAAAEDKEKRLRGGVQPTTARRPGSNDNVIQTEEQAFLSVFNK